MVVLEDNYPGDEYPHLVAVYTAFNVGAATGATVGIVLHGESANSRVNIAYHYISVTSNLIWQKNFMYWQSHKIIMLQ